MFFFKRAYGGREWKRYEDDDFIVRRTKCLELLGERLPHSYGFQKK